MRGILQRALCSLITHSKYRKKNAKKAGEEAAVCDTIIWRREDYWSMVFITFYMPTNYVLNLCLINLRFLIHFDCF